MGMYSKHLPWSFRWGLTRCSVSNTGELTCSDVQSPLLAKRRTDETFVGSASVALKCLVRQERSILPELPSF
eukprot:IDg6540t1